MRDNDLGAGGRAEPVKRLRIELFTDDELRWFALIEKYTSCGMASEYTATAETWSGALSLARERIKENRGTKCDG